MNISGPPRVQTARFAPEDQCLAESLHRSYQAAEGFASLGMYVDAWNELESFPSELRGDESVLVLRIQILQSFGRWQFARELAESLTKNFPANPRWWLSWACCLRWEKTVIEATEVLEEAVELHPKTALIHYNLACFSCISGDMEGCRSYLDAAFLLDPSLKKVAQHDVDLQALPPLEAERVGE